MISVVLDALVLMGSVPPLTAPTLCLKQAAPPLFLSKLFAGKNARSHRKPLEFRLGPGDLANGSRATSRTVPRNSSSNSRPNLAYTL